MMNKSNKKKLLDILIGIGIWIIGYITSIILFPFVSINILGWILCILFTPVTLLITYYRFKSRKESIKYYLLISIIWTITAIIFDYLFIVKLFNSTNYYKIDVFVYYIITFIIPIIIGWRFTKNNG